MTAAKKMSLLLLSSKSLWTDTSIRGLTQIGVRATWGRSEVGNSDTVRA